MEAILNCGSIFPPGLFNREEVKKLNYAVPEIMFEMRLVISEKKVVRWVEQILLHIFILHHLLD